MQDRVVLHLIHKLLGRLADDASLRTLARRAGWTQFHLQRVFRRAMGESPKRYVLRLRLERAAARRIVEWVPKLGYPIRVGEHDQTAFAFGLILDWARVAGDTTTEAAVVEASRRLYLADVACPLTYEPSGQDFLSPCLASRIACAHSAGLPGDSNGGS